MPTDAGNDGYFTPAEIFGHLYLDENNNGVQDAGEPDLANVDVIITDGNGDMQTVTSDDNGDWSALVIPGLTVADVDETDADYPTGSTQTEGDDPTVVVAVAGTPEDAGNDGYYTPTEVFGHLYLDDNNNGMQDAGEPDLADVDVIITDSNGDMQTVTTDANGDWTAPVPAGTTTADVDETDADYPTGSTQTEGNDPTVVEADPDMPTDAGIDGYYLPTMIFGHLYLDENNNGMQDAGEEDLANVDVIVTQSNGDMITATTDANGDWATPVMPGLTVADVDENDPDYPTGSDQTEGDDPTVINVMAGDNTDFGNDGYYIPTFLEGHVYFDSNNNGMQDAGEPDLPNVDVIVSQNDGSMVTATTDANGDWITPVLPGLTVADVDETSAGFPVGADQTEGTDPTITVVPEGTTGNAGNDGYHIPSTVFGHIYLDNNNNGVQDAGEPDIANLDVIITDSNGDMQTVTTDANGDWSADVLPGLTSAVIDNTDPQYPVGAAQTEGDDPTNVNALLGENTDAGIDGFYIPAEVFGHVYLDENNNGMQDADEPNLGGIDVIITDSNGDTQTVTTDTNGDWSASVPAGMTTADIDETDADFPSDVEQSEGDDPTTVTAISGDAIDAGNDGYFPLVPDITPIISFIPGVVNGTAMMAFEIRIQELLDVDTEGLITVVLPKDPRLTFTWDPAMTNVGGVYDVDNPSWTYDDTFASFHVWTTTEVISGGTNLDIGFIAQYDPENSNGEVTYTATIISNSGGENNTLNNIDAETLVYFNN
jgi:phosphatidate phosphatase APP1